MSKLPTVLAAMALLLGALAIAPARCAAGGPFAGAGAGAAAELLAVLQRAPPRGRPAAVRTLIHAEQQEHLFPLGMPPVTRRPVNTPPHALLRRTTRAAVPTAAAWS